MRFSLLTLLLACLTLGSGIGVCVLNGRWQKVQMPGVDNAYLRDFANSIQSARSAGYAPDGVRVTTDFFTTREDVCIYERGQERKILVNFPWPVRDIPGGESLGRALFLDDDHLVISEDFWSVPSASPSHCTVWHRRFPEGWPGHFYRPEVWCAIVFGTLLVWNLLRKPRARNMKPSS